MYKPGAANVLEGRHRPFPQCGGVSDQTVTEPMRDRWSPPAPVAPPLAGGGIRARTSWYRGVSIGRERKTEELSRASVEDINIDGHSGFHRHR